MAHDYPQDWEKKVAFMRDRSVVDAMWNNDGALISAKTAPVPTEADQEETQRSYTPTQREMMTRAEQRRVASAATGGPRVKPEHVG